MGSGERAHLAFGRRAEERVAALLRTQGAVVLDRNYRTPRGEIDLVVRDGEVIVFVEVRARRSEAHGTPAETVKAPKQASILRAARAWLSAHALEDARVRFDVVTLTGSDLGRISVIQDAFGAADPWS